jgi:RNA polymerase sigma factor (sigma-70 family)/anti-anti-sigma factor
LSGDAAPAAGNEPLDEGTLSPSDAELIERCLRKDNAAWELVVARFRRKVFHISYKFTGKHDEAEDLTQEIFLKVFRALDKFNRDADFSTWLSSVARNYCIDHYRASKREKEVVVEDALAYDLAPASSGNPYRALEDQDRRSLVRRGLEQLPGDGAAARPPGGDGQESHQPGPRGARAAAAPRPAAGAAGPRTTHRPAAGGEVMQLAFEDKGDVTVVRVQEAKLTYPVLSAFFSEVRQRVEGGARRVLIDLAAVSYLDSASIGCVMDIHRLLQEKGGALRLSGLQPRVETMISMTGVHKIVPLHRDEEDALAAFGARRGGGR